MRLLRKRDHHDRQSLPRPEPASHRRADPAGHVRRALPLLHAYPDAQSHSPVCSGGIAMKRRDFLKSSGALIVSFSMTPSIEAQFGGPVPGSPPLNQLDSWIAITADGRVTAYSGKEELGQGISTAQAQL